MARVSEASGSNVSLHEPMPSLGKAEMALILPWVLTKQLPVMIAHGTGLSDPSDPSMTHCLRS